MASDTPVGKPQTELFLLPKEQQRWEAITTALNSPVPQQDQSHPEAQHVAALAKEADTTSDRSIRDNDMRDLRAALQAMQGDPVAQRQIIAEADKLLEGSGLTIAQSQGEIWEGKKDANGKYQPTDLLAGGNFSVKSIRDQPAIIATDGPPVNMITKEERLKQQRADEAALLKPVDGTKSDAQEAQRIADLARKLDARRAQEAEIRHDIPGANPPHDWRQTAELGKELKKITAKNDPELLKGTLAAANKLLEQDGIKLGINQGRIIEGKKYHGYESTGYHLQQSWDITTLNEVY